MDVLTFAGQFFIFNEKTPALMTTAVGVFTLILFFILKNKTINIEERKVCGDVYSQQLNDLQVLVKELVVQLTQARQEINEISNQNIELRKHISSLETILIKNNLITEAITKFNK